MATREFLSPGQRAHMLCIPDDLSDQLLARYSTFSDEDLALIKQRQRPKNRLGLLFSSPISVFLAGPGWRAKRFRLVS